MPWRTEEIKGDWIAFQIFLQSLILRSESLLWFKIHPGGDIYACVQDSKGHDGLVLFSQHKHMLPMVLCIHP